MLRVGIEKLCGGGHARKARLCEKIISLETNEDCVEDAC
jgi:hypothetical protein